MTHPPIDATNAWLLALNEVLTEGKLVQPRGQPTREVLHRTDVIDMRRCVTLVDDRSLSFKFMAAEAHWILSGDYMLSPLTKYNARMAEFSDDGVTLFGAYGPPIMTQLPYVVGTLVKDRDSRQAVLTIWRPTPPKTKDVPCTVAMAFNVRKGADGQPVLNAHVFMRSSDLWLGWPYDVFSFSMVAHLVCCRLNDALHFDGQTMSVHVQPGALHLTAASSHLYEPQWEPARSCVASARYATARPTPSHLFIDERRLMETLEDLPETRPGAELRWWI